MKSPLEKSLKNQLSNDGGYYGGKGMGGVYQTIINHITPHDRYVEPFCGNASIFKKKELAISSLITDLDPLICNHINEHLEQKGYTLKNEEKQKWIWEMQGKIVTVMVIDAIEVLEDVIRFCTRNSLLKVFVHLDPPYMKETRRFQTNRYRFELDTNYHEKMLELCLKAPYNCHILISCYDNKLYKKTLSDWHQHSFETKTRGKVKATETIYYNYEVNQLHDYTYLGKDFREREQFKVVSQRAVNKILFHVKDKHPLLRYKVMKELQEAFHKIDLHNIQNPNKQNYGTEQNIGLSLFSESNQSN